jgi:hypothetical protein
LVTVFLTVYGRFLRFVYRHGSRNAVLAKPKLAACRTGIGSAAFAKTVQIDFMQRYLSVAHSRATPRAMPTKDASDRNRPIPGIQ